MKEKIVSGVIIVIILGVVGFVGYFAIRAIFFSPSELVILNYNIDDAEELLTDFGLDWYNIHGLSDVSTNRSLAVYIKHFAFQSLEHDYEEYEKISCKDLALYDEKIDVSQCKTEAVIIPYEEANQKYQQLYGEDTTLEKVSFSYWCTARYHYISEKDGFALLYPTCQNYVTPSSAIEEVMSAYTEGDTLVVEAIFDEGILLDDVYRLAKDETIIWDKNTDLEQIKNEVLQKYSDKLNTYEIRFQKEYGYYVFRSLSLKTVE